MNYEIKEPVMHKKVIISLVGDAFSSRFVVALMSTIGILLRDGKYDVNIVTGADANATNARLAGLGTNVLSGADQLPFNRNDYDYWVSIENECIFSAENLMEMLRSLGDHPVVTAMYRYDLERFNIVESWDVNFFRENGVYPHSTAIELDAWKKQNPDTKYKKIVSTGMGFLGVRREVLTAIKYPYFNSDVATVFTEEGKVLTHLMSDEMSFCKNIQHAGFDIVANTDLIVGREKRLII